MGMQTLVSCLWFDTKAEEAANFWVEVFSGRIGAAGRPKSEILAVTHYPQDGPGGHKAGDVLTIEFLIEGQRFTALNGGPEFTFDEAVSFIVNCESQDEIDELWDRLVEGGGEHGPCSWLKDRFGLSWQVVPTGMDEMLSDPKSEGAQRAFAAMMQMGQDRHRGAVQGVRSAA
jgi:predicted 3-demethylubiquinone-9 3-methyltransferase (glyoxalase superfamily)